VFDGLIREVGPSRRLENLALARTADEIDASGRVVMPGFVDSLTHLVAGPARLVDYEMQMAGATEQQIELAGGGLLAVARAIQDSSPRTLEAQAVHAIETAFRHGTTTLESRSGFGLTEAGENKILRVHSTLQKRAMPVVSTFLTAQTPPDYKDRSDQYIHRLCSHVLPSIKRRKLAEFADIGRSENTFTVEQARRYLTAAHGLGFDLKLHAGLRPNAGAIRMAVELGAASVDDVIDVTEDDARVLAQSPTIATILPGRGFYLRDQVTPPARMLADHGVAIALASNYNTATSPSQNMQMAIALACRNMNLTAAEAITATTINAAHALRLESDIGSLETGKSADLLVISVPDYREIPYHFGVNLVELVMKRGAVVVKKSEVKWPAS